MAVIIPVHPIFKPSNNINANNDIITAANSNSKNKKKDNEIVKFCYDNDIFCYRGSENDVLEYAKEKLAKFKIPKKIFFVEEIPKGATGKLQRNVLAKKFGLNN